jgi:hypothetical protein
MSRSGCHPYSGSSDQNRNLLTAPLSSFFLPRPAVHPAKHRFSTTLFSVTSELLFSHLLCFQKHLRCPMLFSSVYSVPPVSVPSVLGRVFKSFAVNGLPPLVLSCLSFLPWRRLFSVTCGLFLQNTGGGVSPQPLSPLVYADADSPRPTYVRVEKTHRRRSRCGAGTGVPCPYGVRRRCHIDAEKGSEFMGLAAGRRRCSTRFRRSRRWVRLCVARTITRHAGRQHPGSCGLRHRRAR